jgi:hypothetical protein
MGGYTINWTYQANHDLFLWIIKHRQNVWLQALNADKLSLFYIVVSCF